MLGSILKNLRKNKKLTQAQLSAILNLDKSSIAKYETAGVTPSPEVLKLLAKYFDVTVDYLLGSSDEIKKAPSEANKDEAVAQLSKDEAELLSVYRQLDISGKRQTLGKVYELLDKITMDYESDDE